MSAQIVVCLDAVPTRIKYASAVERMNGNAEGVGMGGARRRFLAITLAMSGSVWSAALAADISPRFAISTDAQGLPAVDGINAKVSGFGGSLNGQAMFGGEGSISVPLGYRFGFQLDGLVSGIDSKHHGNVTTTGAAAHLFWRDPAVGLLWRLRPLLARRCL